MTLKLSMDVIRQGKTCEPAIDEMAKYFEENNISEIAFEDVIAHWKKIQRRDWAIWAYENKKKFEELVEYNNTQAEIEADLTEVAYLNTLNHIGYVVHTAVYPTIEEAQIARQQRLADLKEEIEPLVVCNLETTNANGDATWTVVDLDNLEPQLSGNIKVFNPVTGQYVTCTNVQEALLVRNEFIVVTTDHMHITTKIAKALQHPDYPDEIISDYDL